MKIYVMQLFIAFRLGSRRFDESKIFSVVLINYFVYLWYGKDQTIGESVKILIINLLFMFICQKKKKTLAQSEFKKK